MTVCRCLKKSDLHEQHNPKKGSRNMTSFSLFHAHLDGGGMYSSAQTFSVPETDGGCTYYRIQ